MVPPGVQLCILNERAAAVREALPRVSRFWDWTRAANRKEFSSTTVARPLRITIYGPAGPRWI